MENEYQDVITKLKKQLAVSKASQVYMLQSAYQNIGKASTDKYFGSSIMLTIKNININTNNEVVEEVAISGGLSTTTIEAIRKDMLRSFENTMEIPLSVLGYKQLSKG